MPFGRFFGDCLRDLRYATRVTAARPGITGVIVLSLAVGIGANTAIFTVVDALMFRPPAGVFQPDRLVEVGASDHGYGFNPTSYLTYQAVRSRATTLDGVYASPMGTDAMSLGDAGAGSDRVFVRYVTTNFFTTLGAVPAVGRLLGAADSDDPGASPSVVLSHRLWAQRFGSDPAVVGSSIRLDGRAFTVVGVAADGFRGTSVRRVDLWMPLGMMAQARDVFANADAGWLFIGGRLKPGVPRAAAAAEVSAIAPAGTRLSTDPAERRQLRLEPSSAVSGGGSLSGFLTLLFGIVSAVTAIACTNVTGVLLARAAARQRELAVRLAIGGDRGRLVRQCLAETLLLFAMGGAGGVLLARGITLVAVKMLPALPFPVEVSLAIDGRAILYTGGLILLAGIASGLAPALYATKPDVASLLGAGALAPLRLRARRALVVVEVALSIVLVVTSGLFARSLQAMGAANPGFEPAGVELVSLDLSKGGHTDVTGALLVRDLLERLRRSPLVSSASAALSAPGGFEGFQLGGLGRPGDPVPALTDGDWNAVEPGYFATMGVRLVAGRDFTQADRLGGEPVVILGEGAAARLWPGRAPSDIVGEALVHRFLPFNSGATGPQVAVVRVVGIAGDVRDGSLVDGAADAQVYVPFEQHYLPRVLLAVRSRTGGSVRNEIRAVLAVAAPSLPIDGEQSAEEYASLGLVIPRVAAYVAGSLGLFGALLAAVGIYGITAYGVSRRTREIGIRTAIGARRTDILGMILREGVTLGAAGSIIGLVLAAALGQVLTTVLSGVPPIDLVAFGGTALLFASVSVAACCVPAYRATRIRAVEALRSE